MSHATSSYIQYTITILKNDIGMYNTEALNLLKCVGHNNLSRHISIITT